jgi:hypothetical protein
VYQIHARDSAYQRYLRRGAPSVREYQRYLRRGAPSVRDSYISNVPTQGGSKCTRLTAIFKGSANLSDEAESEGLVEPRKDAFSRTSGPVSHKVIWRFGNSSPSSWNDFVS